MPFDDNTFLTYRQPQDPVLQLIIDGLAYIRRCGWIQDRFIEQVEEKDTVDGPVCALGALGYRTDRDPTEEMKEASKFMEDIINDGEEKRAEKHRNELQTMFGEDWEMEYWDDECEENELGVEEWNDDGEREQSEVEALFERAIALRQKEAVG